MKCQVKFLSTLSLRRATLNCSRNGFAILYFYPRSPCGERRVLTRIDTGNNTDFYPRSPCGERPHVGRRKLKKIQFLSTLSLRRATAKCKKIIKQQKNFYPRSPCGERRVTVLGIQHKVGISIHALLAESDLGQSITLRLVTLFLSTLSLRRATSQGADSGY